MNLEFDKKKLTENNGKDGKPAYVAANSKVYDVSESKLWKNGLHMNRHQAGQDLTEALGAAPHGTEVLNKFKQIGTLQEEAAEVQPPIPKWLHNFLEAHPFYKRHPHPMVVHFPMTFFITASIFLFWYYVISAVECLLASILYLHILGTISMPFAMGTGWLSWKVNYLGKPIGNITRKIIFSIIVLIFDIVVLISLLNNPGLLSAPQGIQIVIPIMIFLYLPFLAYIGQQGGDLVY
ncbi:MAG: hypothetical protein JSW07_19530 [bacterium]|nr:MAG: hypothetical protein JSW07_19530 [bacterium]